MQLFLSKTGFIFQKYVALLNTQKYLDLNILVGDKAIADIHTVLKSVRQGRKSVNV